MRKNNAGTIFAICHFVFMKPMTYEFTYDKIGRVSWFTDFIDQFCRSTEPRPQKLAGFINHVQCP